MWRALDKFTLRMEAVEVLLMSDGKYPRVNQGKVTVYNGVGNFACQWAEREWWPRLVARPDHFGKGLKGYHKALDDLMKKVEEGKGHVLAFWDGECSVTAELMELVRDRTRMRHFHVRRC